MLPPHPVEHDDARLDDLLNHIQQRWGTHALRPLRTVTAARPPVPTGFAALDSLLGGGVPAGQVTELLGRPTSGVTTLAYSSQAGSGVLTLLGALPSVHRETMACGQVMIYNLDRSPTEI